MFFHIQNIKIDFINNKLYLCVDNKYDEYFIDKKTIKEKLKCLVILLNRNECTIKYYAIKGKFWYLYNRIKKSNLLFFHNNKIKRKYLNAFLDKFLYLYDIEKNEYNYYLLNVKSIYEFDLVNVKPKNNGYRILKGNINDPMSKFRAYALSHYCYTNIKNDVFLPVSYDDIKNNKFSYKKLKKQYLFFNTNYNRFEILAQKMTYFHLQYVQYSDNNDFNNRLFLNYRNMVIEDGIELINLIFNLKVQAYLHFELNKEFANKNSGLYKMFLFNKKRIDNDFNDLLVYYKKCYKFNIKQLSKRDLIKKYKKYYQKVLLECNSYKIIKN